MQMRCVYFGLPTASICNRKLYLQLATLCLLSTCFADRNLHTEKMELGFGVNALVFGLVMLGAAITFGNLDVPLPYPGLKHQKVIEIPPEQLPPEARPLEV